MSRPRSLALSAACLAAGVLHAQQGTFRGDDAHTGVYAGSTKSALAGFAWRTATDGEVIASPTIVNGIIYIGSGDGKFYALDARKGTLRWTFDAGSAVSSTAAVDGGRVYFGARDGTFYALRTKDGKRIWKFRTRSEMPLHWGHESGDFWTSSPTVALGRVLFGSGDGALYAVSAAKGKLLWRTGTEGRVRATPAVDGDRVVFGSFDGTVRCLSLATGTELWRFTTTGATLESGSFGFDRRSIQSSPAIANGAAFIGARDGFLYAIDLATGKEKWRYDHQISWVNASSAVSDGVVYAASSDGHFVQAVDAATGAERWRSATDLAVWSSPAVSGDRVYVGDFAGRVRALDRRDGALRWSFRTGSQVLSSPAVFEDLVIVGSTDGAVYALRTTDIPTQRAVFFDSAYLKATQSDERGKTAAYLAHRDYQQLDAAQLATWLEARVADRAPSTLVFAIEFVPEAIASKPYEQSLFRRYLDGGGKVVWLGLPPAVWPRDSTGGFAPSLLALDWGASSALLGVDVSAAIFDRRGVRATSVGSAWGLPTGHWRDAWSVDVRGVTQVLALDEWGLAAAWVKSYGGAPGTGFVRVPGSDPFIVYLAAEYRP